MHAFDVETQTVPTADYAFTGKQAAKAQESESVRVFRWADLQGNVKRLPKYVIKALTSAGYCPVYLGGTTYSHSVIGLVPMAKR